MTSLRCEKINVYIERRVAQHDWLVRLPSGDAGISQQAMEQALRLDQGSARESSSNLRRVGLPTRAAVSSIAPAGARESCLGAQCLIDASPPTVAHRSNAVSAGDVKRIPAGRQARRDPPGRTHSPLGRR